MDLKLLTVPEVAEILRLEVKTLYSPLQRSKIGLAVIKIGGKYLVDEKDLLRVLAENKQEPPPWPGSKRIQKAVVNDAAD